MKKITSLLFLLAFLLVNVLSLRASELNFYVGYSTVALQQGVNNIANNYIPGGVGGPLIKYVIPAPVVGTIFEQFVTESTYKTSVFMSNAAWSVDTLIFNRGDGGLMVSPTNNASVILFGKIPLGTIITTYTNKSNFPAYQFIGSKFPVGGLLTSQLNFKPSSGDIVYKPISLNGVIKYEAYIYDVLLGGWWPNEPVISQNTGFLYKNLSNKGAVWAQKSWPQLVGPSDGRKFGIFDIGDVFGEGNHSLQVSVTQKAGENLEFQYSSNNGATWSVFAAWGPPAADQTTAAYHSVQWFSANGLIRMHITK